MTFFAQRCSRRLNSFARHIHTAKLQPLLVNQRLIGGSLFVGAVAAYVSFELRKPPTFLDSTLPYADPVSIVGTGHLTTLPTSAILRKLFVFEILSRPTLVKFGEAVIELCDKWNLSFLYKPFLRITFYKHFCGGENADQVEETIRNLSESNIRSILANNVEAEIGQKGIADRRNYFNRFAAKSLDGHLAAVDHAEKLPNNFISMKITSLLDPDSLLALNNILIKKSSEQREFETDIADSAKELSSYDREQLQNASFRLNKLCEHAKSKNVKVLVDAEQVYLQKAVDLLVIDLCDKINDAPEPVVYNTYQMYIKGKTDEVQQHLEHVQSKGASLGLKIVRGAYIASDERSLIHDTKEDTDKAYDSLVNRLLTSSDFANTSYGAFIATHNNDSIIKAIDALKNQRPKQPVYFGQLYGMCDDLTHYVASKLLPTNSASDSKIGVFKCLPFGPIDETIPYLIRRGNENAAVLDRTFAERTALRRELWRRLTFQPAA